jgi:hypothetical protein
VKLLSKAAQIQAEAKASSGAKPKAQKAVKKAKKNKAE